MTRAALMLAAFALLVGLASAGPKKIDRTIGKEPVYQTKTPRYGLLVFDAEGKDRVWLVLDGDVLYVDRNGNGDLTEPSNKVAAEKKPHPAAEEDGYAFEVGAVAAGGRKHKGLAIYLTPLRRYADGSLGRRPDVKAALAKDPKAAAVTLNLDVEVPGTKGGGVGGRLAFMAGPVDLTGVFQLADKPAEAPVVLFGGPLQITFYGELPSLRVGRDCELDLVVGTPGIGPGTFAMLGYQDTIPEDAKPGAKLSLPPAKADQPRLEETFVVKGRC